MTELANHLLRDMLIYDNRARLEQAVSDLERVAVSAEPLAPAAPWSELFDELLNKVFSHLAFTHLLQCRAVCRKWAAAVHTWVDELPRNLVHKLFAFFAAWQIRSIDVPDMTLPPPPAYTFVGRFTNLRVWPIVPWDSAASVLVRVPDTLEIFGDDTIQLKRCVAMMEDATQRSMDAIRHFKIEHARHTDCVYMLVKYLPPLISLEMINSAPSPVYDKHLDTLERLVIRQTCMDELYLFIVKLRTRAVKLEHLDMDLWLRPWTGMSAAYSMIGEDALDAATGLPLVFVRDAPPSQLKTLKLTPWKDVDIAPLYRLFVRWIVDAVNTLEDVSLQLSDAYHCRMYVNDRDMSSMLDALVVRAPRLRRLTLGHVAADSVAATALMDKLLAYFDARTLPPLDYVRLPTVHLVATDSVTCARAIRAILDRVRAAHIECDIAFHHASAEPLEQAKQAIATLVASTTCVPPSHGHHEQKKVTFQWFYCAGDNAVPMKRRTIYI